MGFIFFSQFVSIRIALFASQTCSSSLPPRTGQAAHCSTAPGNAKRSSVKRTGFWLAIFELISQTLPASCLYSLKNNKLFSLKRLESCCSAVHFSSEQPSKSYLYTSRDWLYSKKPVFGFSGVFYRTRRHRIQLNANTKCFKSYGLYIRLRAKACRKADLEITC